MNASFYEKSTVKSTIIEWTLVVIKKYCKIYHNWMNASFYEKSTVKSTIIERTLVFMKKVL